jgi:uncharacterized protein with von Willebrand factor type A (vWA) domain
MIRGLERFVADLRAAGVAASPAEWIDALRAVGTVGLDDRERFRTALRCALVKHAGQRETFDRLFDRFFASPARGRSHGGGRERPAAEGARGTSARAVPGAPGAARKEARPPEGGPPRESRETELHRDLQQARQGGPRRRGRMRRVVVEERSRKEERRGPVQRGASDPFETMRRDLRRPLDVEDETRLAEELPRVVRRIRLRSGRRLRRARRGKLNLRHAFRDNLSRGGVPFVLPFRRLRPRRSRVVLLIDVSWSTARAAGLFLCMAFALLRRAADTRVLLFVDRVVDGTVPIHTWVQGGGILPGALDPVRRAARRPGMGIRRGAVSFADLLGSLRDLNFEAPSDYGRAFHGLRQSHLRPSGRNTVLVVLGDGRTNRFDAQAWAFEEITRRCGAVLWLVPEGVEEWGTGDSALEEYLPHVDVAVESRDLAGLACGVTALLRRL